MEKGLRQRLLLPLIGIIAAGVAHASPPSEKLVCTTAPRSAWMPEAKIREAFGEKNYALVKFKVSRGHCYEFYAVHRDGSIVEAYFHPLSGEMMRFNRVSASASVPAYESRNVAQPVAQP
ncbi:MAG: PepSY domain-containing protein [Dechloromonas sp.]|nr:MAG: PepSY domain-containing protein [Dechloromonas sp.]